MRPSPTTGTKGALGLRLLMTASFTSVLNDKDLAGLTSAPPPTPKGWLEFPSCQDKEVEARVTASRVPQGPGAPEMCIFAERPWRNREFFPLSQVLEVPAGLEQTRGYSPRLGSLPSPLTLG